MADPATDEQIADFRDSGDDRALTHEMLIARIEAEKAKLDKLKKAVNADRDCLPSCDSYGHDDDCPATNTALWLIDMQERIDAETARADSFDGEALKQIGKQAERIAALEGELKIANEMSGAFDRMKIASDRIAELLGLVAELLALNPTVSGDMLKAQQFAAVLARLRAEVRGEGEVSDD